MGISVLINNNGFFVVRTEKETVAVLYNHGANIYVFFGMIS